MWRVKPDCTPFLRVRCKPNGDIIGKFMPNTAINVLEVTDGWARVRVADTVDVWVSAAYIESNQTAPIVTHRKIGLHLHTGSNADACVRVYAECANAGKPIPLAVVINNTGLVDAIKAVSPLTFVVYRGGVVDGQDVLPLIQDDNQANFLAGEKRFNERYAACWADAFQVGNEAYDKGFPAWKVEAFAYFYIGAMAAAEARNTFVTVGDFAVGGPEIEHLELLKPMLSRAESKGHPLNYHSYCAPKTYDITSQSEWYALRWVRITEGYPKMRVLNGEMGGFFDNGPDPMGICRQYYAMTATMDCLIGSAMFTANAAKDWQDRGFGFDGHLGEYAIWHKSL